jgi:hypothetical protein
VTDPVAVGDRLLAAIVSRDFDTIEACFAEVARFDALTPHTLRRHRTAAEAADRYRYWLDRLEHFEVLEHEAVLIADRARIRYLLRGRDPRSGWSSRIGRPRPDRCSRARSSI